MRDINHMRKECKHPTCGPTCRRPPKQKQRTRIKPVSRKQARRLRRYNKEKQQRYQERPVCAVALIENKSPEVLELFKDCQYWATEQHHPAGREGERLFDKCVDLCGNCHQVAEINPIVSKSLGLSKSRIT